MTDDDDEPARKLRIASRLYAYSEGEMKCTDAMKVAGYATPERKRGTVYQRVRRTAARLSMTSKNPPATVLLGNNQNDSSISSTSLTSNVAGSISFETNQSSTARSLLSEISVKEKQKRRRPKDKQYDDAARIRRRRVEVNAMKVATRKISYSRHLPNGHPEKSSDIDIVRGVNELHSSSISVKSASMMVRDGRIGVSPLPYGPSSIVNTQIWSLLKGAFVSFINLEQAHGSTQSSMKILGLKVNKCLNRGGLVRNDLYFMRKLRKETANKLDIGERNVIEERRSKWTTYTNLNLWYDTWERILIDLGFGRKKRENELCEGSIVFFHGQTDRIINLDETDGSMDNTTGQRGGRPNFVFYSNNISGGASRANKTAYSPTIIAGSTASGDPLPLHFQLKTSAQTNDTQKLGIDFFKHAKDVYGKFGYKERRAFPCTWGMNEKAGMNSEELGKYFTNSILPLYPDVEDAPRKRYVLLFICAA